MGKFLPYFLICSATITVVFIIFLVFGIIPKNITNEIYRFQVLITGAIGGFAAVITAISIYLAATKPIDEERRKEKNRMIEQSNANSALLLIGIQKIDACFNIEMTSHNPREIKIPELLIEKSVFSDQDPSVINDIANIIMLIEIINADIALYGKGAFSRSFKNMTARDAFGKMLKTGHRLAEKIHPADLNPEQHEELNERYQAFMKKFDNELQPMPFPPDEEETHS